MGLYVGLALKNPMRFLEANTAGLIRGLILGILFWPIGIMIELIGILK
jgi:hypothetical protein